MTLLPIYPENEKDQVKFEISKGATERLNGKGAKHPL
jgi:hypothetical protein